MRLFKTTKIKISLLWIPYCLLLPFLPVSKVIFFIFIILSVHEMAHIFFARIFRYQIEKIIIYPFGICASIPDLGFGNLIKEMLIICAGPLTHVFIPFLFYWFLQLKWISPIFYDYLLVVNANILIFNLLLIYPLDGGRFMQTFFHSLFVFKTAQKLTFSFSILCMIVLIYFHFINGISALFVLFFLCLQIFMSWREQTLQALKFYYYRSLHEVSGKIILHQKHDLYRGRYNYIKSKRGWQDEKKWLQYNFFSKRKS